MKNDKSQFVVRTSDFHLSLFIGHFSFVISPGILASLRRIFTLVVQMHTDLACSESQADGSLKAELQTYLCSSVVKRFFV
jgi:hypothetical protein